MPTNITSGTLPRKNLLEIHKPCGVRSPHYPIICNLTRVPDEKHADSSDGLWSIYLTEAEKRDTEVIEKWKSDTNGILVFVSPVPVPLVHVRRLKSARSRLVYSPPPSRPSLSKAISTYLPILPIRRMRFLFKYLNNLSISPTGYLSRALKRRAINHSSRRRLPSGSTCCGSSV
jgi:hypothetical protein